MKLGHARLRVVEVTEHDGASRATLLASGLELAVGDGATFYACLDSLLLDSLHAVSALFHDAAAADGHVGVHPQPAHGRGLTGVIEEVEAPHLVRTVVAAVPRADAAVVNHLVQ